MSDYKPPHITKPAIKMKTVIRNMEGCIYFNDCKNCHFRTEKMCQSRLFSAALYYLRQTLEKSEKEKSK